MTKEISDDWPPTIIKRLDAELPNHEKCGVGIAIDIRDAQAEIEIERLRAERKELVSSHIEYENRIIEVMAMNHRLRAALDRALTSLCTADYQAQEALAFELKPILTQQKQDKTLEF